METVGFILVAIEAIAILIAIVLIAYLIFRRIRLKSEETFEKREN